MRCNDDALFLPRRQLLMLLPTHKHLQFSVSFYKILYSRTRTFYTYISTRYMHDRNLRPETCRASVLQPNVAGTVKDVQYWR